MRKKSQDFGPITVDLETEEVTNWLNANARLAAKLTKLGKDVFHRTHSTAMVQNALIDYLQNVLVEGAVRLKAPFSGLALIAMEKIDWDNLVRPFTEAFEGPQYMEEEEELTSLEQALQTMQEEFPEVEEIPEGISQPSSPLTPEWRF